MTKDQNTLDPQIAALPLKALKLPMRPFNVLKKANIETIGQLARFSEQDLLNLYNFGAKSLQDVRHALAAMGLQNLLSVSTTETKPTKQTLFSAFQITDFPSELAGVSIGVLALSTRLQNTLERSGIWTLGDLGQSELSRICEIRTIGEKAIKDIQEAFSNLEITQVRAKVLRKSPDTLVKLSLALTSLPEKITRVLNRAKIKNVASLSQLTLKQLRQLGLSADDYDKIQSELKTHYIGVQLLTAESKAEAVETVAVVSTNQPKSSSAEPSKILPLDHLLPNSSIFERIEQMLAQLNARQAQVLRWRYGLDGNESLILEEVGSKLGLTRERARQIQKEAIKKLQIPYHRGIMEPLIHLLEQALEEKHGLLSTEIIQNLLCAQGEYKPISPESLLEFVLLFANGRIKQFKKPLFIILNVPPYNMYHHHLLAILLVFDKILTQTRAPLSESQLLERFARHKKGQTIAAEVPTEYLKACLDAHPKMEINKNGEYVLKRWKNRVVDDIIVVLRKHGKPLHYREITKRVNQRVSKQQQITARNIHSKLGHYQDVFVRVGHGIFGLADWGLQQDRSLREAAIRVLHEAGHPLNIQQMTDRVLDTWNVKRTSVQAAIYLEPRIVRIRPNLYWLADSAQEKEQETEHNTP